MLAIAMGQIASMQNVPPPREQALLPQVLLTQVWLVYTRKSQAGCQAASPLILILIWSAPLTTMAERRHCAVGIPAWMPG